MRKVVLFVAVMMFLLSFSKKSSEVKNDDVNWIGAWKSEYTDAQNQSVEAVAIVTDGFISVSQFNLETKQFFNTYGGSWVANKEWFDLTYEFNTEDPKKVGIVERNTFKYTNDELYFNGSTVKWTRIDDGSPGKLTEAYLITGRKRGEDIQRSTPGDRKTMKILSGTRFQWIAYNVADGGFFGTGGGNYTTKNGVYTENIEFFSRDSSRVGATLSFDFEINNGEWHHSGLNSRGEPLFEIWTPRNKLK